MPTTDELTTTSCLNLDSRFTKDENIKEVTNDVRKVYEQVDTVEEFQYLTVALTVLQLLLASLNAFAAQRNLQHADDARLPAVTRARRRSVLPL